MPFYMSFDYLNAIYNISIIIHKNAIEKRDNRLIAISSVITNYFNSILKKSSFRINELTSSDHINLVPFFEYVSMNNIEFYDFSNIKLEDVDVTNENDLERYVLTHIYYLTQK